MKICFISDTHTRHDALTGLIPDCDVLVHAGDLTGKGDPYDVKLFCEWIDSITNATHKLVIAGNHDFCFEGRSMNVLYAKDYMKRSSATYLFDESVVIDGVKFYGSPWQPEFCSWAFNLPRMGHGLKACWDKIPDDTDVVITHGPPHGILDLTFYHNEYAGCELLLERMKELCPAIHVFGHIHEGYGVIEDGVLGTTFINASTCTLQYKPTNKPILVEYDKTEGLVTVLTKVESDE